MISLKLKEYEDAEVRAEHGIDYLYYELDDGEKSKKIYSSTFDSVIHRLRWTRSKYSSLYEDFIQELLYAGMKPSMAEKLKKVYQNPELAIDKIRNKRLLENWHKNAYEMISELTEGTGTLLLDVDNPEIGKKLDEILEKYGQSRNRDSKER